MEADNTVKTVRIPISWKDNDVPLSATPKDINLAPIFTRKTSYNNLSLDEILENRQDYEISNVKVKIMLQAKHKYHCSDGSWVEIYNYPGINISDRRDISGCCKIGEDTFNINKEFSYTSIPSKKSITINMSREKSDCTGYAYKDVDFLFELSFRIKSRLFDICREGENSLTGTSIPTPVFRSRFMLIGETGDKCRQWALNMRDQGKKSVVDTAYKSFCDKYPDTVECRCINRSKISDYNIINTTMTSRIPDGCWWIPCKDTFTYLVPSDVLDGGQNCQAYYCGVFLDNIGNANVDQNNISCTNNQTNTETNNGPTNGDGGTDVIVDIDTDGKGNGNGGKPPDTGKPKRNTTLYLIIGIVISIIVLIMIIIIVVVSRKGDTMSPYLSIPPPTLS